MANQPGTTPGRFAYEGLERALHEKARLGLVTSLMRFPDGLVFTDLKELCQLSDGNLNRHLEVLKTEGLVEVWKKHDRRPQTLVKLTAAGRARFLAYLEELERVLQDAKAAAPAATKPGKLGVQPS